MKLKLTLFACLMLLAKATVFSQHDPKALKDWQDQKYSMFIHFGVYSVLGGVWDGKPSYRNVSEQIQAHAGIYSDDYERVAKRFNPTNWNADSIVSLAKKAGMRSIVITSKHHDGFCMFKTNTTDFNIVDASPYKRDVLKELSDACKRGGLRFGLYFSLIDWHFPQASPISGSNSDYITPEHVELNKKQITELLTNYGKVSELWFDMGSQSPKESKELAELVHKLQPDCMVGSRIGNDMGDFNVMGDNQEPDYAIGVPWQSPASFFHETWGYRSFQKRGREEDKIREKLTSLIQVASRGGNFLLNIGPKGDGSVVDFERDVLLKIGAWLRKNGEAIYGTDPDPFHVAFKWGSLTSRTNKLYLHLLRNPEQGKILLPGLIGKVKNISVLGERAKIKYTQRPTGLELSLPTGLGVDKEFKVISIEFVNGFKVPPANVIQDKSLPVVLNGHNAFKHYSSSGVDYSNRYQSTVKESWTFQPTANKTMQPVLYYGENEKGKEIDLEIGTKTNTVSLSGGKEEMLNKGTGTSWGKIYQSGSYYSGPGGVHGNLKNIDLGKPWPNGDSPVWQLKADWKNNAVYEVEADKSSATYLLQEIESDRDQTYAIGVTSGDAVTVALNGQVLDEHNNPLKVRSMSDIILLPLKKGKNQLIVKFYNGFQKSSTIGIATDVKQVIYRKELKPISVEKGQYYPISWKLHHPYSPHTTLGLPNVRLELNAK